jgi:hypothetical protein
MMACAIPFFAQAQRFALIDMEYIMQNITNMSAQPPKWKICRNKDKPR